MYQSPYMMPQHAPICAPSHALYFHKLNQYTHPFVVFLGNRLLNIVLTYLQREPCRMDRYRILGGVFHEDDRHNFLMFERG